MNRAILMVAAALALFAVPAMAQSLPGVNLSWDDCNASVGTGLNKASACTSNAGVAGIAYGTYVLPPPGTVATAGNDIVLDIMVNSAQLPCWWNFDVAPRTDGYEMQFNTVCADANSVGIFDYWATIPGGPFGGSGVRLLPSAVVPRVRIVGVVAVDGAKAAAVPDGVEVYSFTFRLLNSESVGSCMGCSIPACFFLSLIQVDQLDDPSFVLTNPSSRSFVFWQGGALLPGECAFAVPTQNKTWGAVKALYR